MLMKLVITNEKKNYFSKIKAVYPKPDILSTSLSLHKKILIGNKNHIVFFLSF